MTDKPQMPDEIYAFHDLTTQNPVRRSWIENTQDGDNNPKALKENSAYKFNARYVRSDLCAPTDKDEALRAFNRIKNQVNPYGGYIFGKSIYQWQADLEILEEFINGK